MACCNGRLEVATWLFGLGGVDINGFSELAFRSACRGGHLDVATWLVGLGGVDIHASKNKTFRTACRDGHVYVSRWLVTLDPEYAWPPEALAKLCCWSDARDARLKSVVCMMGRR